jgi:arylsulfatase A-like enzyme
VAKLIEGEVARHYAASILHLHDAIGRIVQAIEKTGKANNTLIIFTSDNGGSTAENNDTKYPNINDDFPSGTLPGSNLPLGEKKGNLHEGSTRVPTLVRWPGTIAAETTTETSVHIVDWMPTFRALAGSKANAAKLKWDKTHIWPVLSDTGSLPERSLYSAGTHFRSQALRDGDWKLIVHKSSEGKEIRTELYNIEKDPNEEFNNAETRPDKLADLRAELTVAATNYLDAVAIIE